MEENKAEGDEYTEQLIKGVVPSAIDEEQPAHPKSVKGSFSKTLAAINIEKILA